MDSIPKKQRIIEIGGLKLLVIDLTQPLKLDTEVYPGDPKPSREIFSEIGKTGWHHFIHRVGDHNFQHHADAPNHQNPETQNGIETFGLEYCFNKAFMIDLSESGDATKIEGIKYLIEINKRHLEPFSELLSNASAVIIRTGYDLWLEANKAHTPENLPYLNEAASKYLASFLNLKVVGIDSLTVDKPGFHISHQSLKDKLIVESLVNLHQIPNRLLFDLQTSPVRIVGATGGPIVAYAFIGL